ncbi:MAG: chemotaxis protein CheB [Desulfococcaceae bacterium]
MTESKEAAAAPGADTSNQFPPEKGEAMDHDFHIVGVGASAGGLEALIYFFETMPSAGGMAFVVVQHLSPDHKSLMGELLAKHTDMEILPVSDGLAVRPNCIYLPPPQKNLNLFNGSLLLIHPPPNRGLNLPIDVFFCSLAEDQEENAIGIILSGTGSDGTRGIQAIKKAGGMVMVQDERSAKFDGMPRSAIQTGLVDYVLRPGDMPETLLSFTRHPLIAGKRREASSIASEETDMTKIIAMLRSKTGVDFTYYKQSTIIRRIERRMGIVQCVTLSEYLAYIYENPEETGALYKDLLIGVTKFYRDRDDFDYLREKIIPVLFENNREEKRIRVWVAGCSTGEEAYTIAILLQDYMDAIGEHYEIKVFATDIDQDAIEKASLGHYSAGIATDLSPHLLDRFFTKTEDGYAVKRHVREQVIFAIQNVLRDPPFTKLDLITCRNLLIYLQNNLQRDVLHIFDFALKDGGYLFLGTSESVGDMSDRFVTVDRKVKIFSHRGTGPPPIQGALRVRGGRKPSGPAPPQTTGQRSQAGLRGQLEAQERYYQEIINRLTPLCVIVNEEGELVETFGDPAGFLRLSTGKTSFNITRMVPRQVGLALNTAIRNAVKDRREVVYRDIRAEDDGEERLITVRVAPMSVNGSEVKKALVIFESGEAGEKDRPGALDYSPDNEKDQRLIDMEREIQFTRENLQATIEELQTANEELQATNEELLASNEELQSTNEELNSVNEELNTVNAEYQTKIVELTELNNDMDNLFRSTDIGTIFLDQELRIRKFTPAATRTVNLLRQDMGRPLSDLSGLVLDEIRDDVRTVLRNGEKVEREIRGEGDIWYLVRILPYLDQNQRRGGVVITLVDITDQKQSEIAFRMQYDLLRRVLETSPAATLMVDRDGKISFINRAAEVLLEAGGRNLRGLALDARELGLRDLDGLALGRDNGPLEMLDDPDLQTERYVLRVNLDGGRETVFSVTGNLVVNERREVDGAVFKFEKIAHKDGEPPLAEDRDE